MNYRLFLKKVEHRTPPHTLDPEELAGATLRALGDRLATLDRDAVARQLPSELAAQLRACDGERSFDLDGFYHAVASDLGAQLSHAAEGAQIVCEVLGEAVDEEGIRHLTHHLDEAAGRLFEPRARDGASRPPRPEGDVTAGRTIASGRPGSRDPLASGRPGARDPVASSSPGHRDDMTTGRPTQADSVEQENPHGRRKLSSGKPDYEE